MRFSVGFGSGVIAALTLLAGCGGNGGSPDVACTGMICPCSEAGIRAAVREGGGTFRFDCDGPTEIVTRAEIVIDNDVALNGEGNLTVNGEQRHRVFSVDDDATVELIGFNVINGRQNEEHGGCIRNAGNLTLTDSVISDCSAGRESGCRTDDLELLCSEGGGIWNAGTLTLSGSTVSSSTSHFGGGIGNRQGSVSLIDSNVVSSVAQGCRGTGAVVCSGGGGIWNSSSLTLIDSTVSNNRADWGGGIYSRGAPTILDGSRISDNSSGFDGGGLLNFDALTLFDTTVVDNEAGQSGGGIANQSPGTLELSSSTLSANSAAAAGGALYNPGGAAADLLNATISGNGANTGGAIYAGGELTVTSGSLVDNAAPSGSAIYDPRSPGTGSWLMMSTVVVGDCIGSSLESGGYNIESPGNTCGLDQPTDLPSQAELGLGPLADNGGPTETHALLDGSVAIDQIPESNCIDGAGEPLSTDQRGEPRPGGPGSACDIGAFEFQP